MEKLTIEKFSIVGLAIRTTNENGQAARDIPALWKRFMEERVADYIPDKADNALYCIYTDYEKDHTRPYTTILGCKVQNLNIIPEGMTGRTFEEGEYVRYVAEGDLSQGSVYHEWVRIWNSDVPRAYAADFEVYEEKALQTGNAAVDIFVSIR